MAGTSGQFPEGGVHFTPWFPREPGVIGLDIETGAPSWVKAINDSFAAYDDEVAASDRPASSGPDARDDAESGSGACSLQLA